MNTMKFLEQYEVTEQDQIQTLETCLISREPLKLKVFPKKQKKKIVLLNEIIGQFHVEKIYTEREVSEILKEIYGDFTTLRRALVDYGYLGRTENGQDYWVNSSLELVKPTLAHKDEILAYKQEFLENGDLLQGTALLGEAESVEAWLESLETTPENWVPSTTYLAIHNGRLVGMLNFRHHLNDHLLKDGGHIGYSVRKSERRKGYAKEMLRQSLEEARKLGLDKVLVTCETDNIASAKTIQSNGGVLEDTRENKQRYWIGL